MSSTLLLPEQAASRVPKINNTTMRLMTGLHARPIGIKGQNVRQHGGRRAPLCLRSLDEQPSRREHDPRNERGYAGEQQELIQYSDGHGGTLPVLRRPLKHHSPQRTPVPRRKRGAARRMTASSHAPLTSVPFPFSNPRRPACPPKFDRMSG